MYFLINFQRILSFNIFTGTHGREPIYFHIHNCTANVCILKRNVEVVVETSFKAETSAIQLGSTMYGKAFGIWFPLDLEEKSEVCKHLITGQCPLPAYTHATYKLELTVPLYTPKRRADIKLVINNEKNDIVACAISTVQITD